MTHGIRFTLSLFQDLSRIISHRVLISTLSVLRSRLDDNTPFDVSIYNQPNNLGGGVNGTRRGPRLKISKRVHMDGFAENCGREETESFATTR